jgi:hypothetical protein
MTERLDEIRLGDGTLIRHKVVGYEGRIDGTTAIRECFTAAGESLGKLNAKQAFQYRVAVVGEVLRRIAPAEDLEILEGVATVVCPSCKTTFQSEPGADGKARGRCGCGEWICPVCLCCQGPGQDSKKPEESACLKQRKRLVSRLAREKRKKTMHMGR